MTLKAEWIEHCLRLTSHQADLYSGARKIITNQSLNFTALDNSLQLSDAGYTKSKLTMLTRNYLHHESTNVAILLWDKRRKQEKYGSVGFTTYAHFVKGGSIDAKRSKRASVFGPCIQSVVMTLLNKREYTIDVFYRTTELFKKFAPDLVFLRDVLLSSFDYDGLYLKRFTCHFANVTIHPMYFVTILPHLPNPIQEFERIKKEELRRRRDQFFYNWLIKWSARYLCEEHSRGILKFSQALRVRKDVMTRMNRHTRKLLTIYLRDNHPGFRNDYEDPDDQD